MAEIPNSTPEVQPETVIGDQVQNPRCQGILSNNMQCQRNAAFKKSEAPDSWKEQLCEPCIALLSESERAAYTVPVERPKTL